jgi:hypothetical protein
MNSMPVSERTDEVFERDIRSHLDASIESMTPTLNEGLQRARQRAMARVPEPAARWRLAAFRAAPGLAFASVLALSLWVFSPDLLNRPEPVPLELADPTWMELVELDEQTWNLVLTMDPEFAFWLIEAERQEDAGGDAYLNQQFFDHFS